MGGCGCKKNRQSEQQPSVPQITKKPQQVAPPPPPQKIERETIKEQRSPEKLVDEIVKKIKDINKIT